MLLLVTVALVFAGLVLLIVGFVQDSLSLIYLSIACAAVAGIALIVFSRLSRRRAVRLAIEGVPAAAGSPSPVLARSLADEGMDLRPRTAPGRQPAPVYGGAEEPAFGRGAAAFPEEYEFEEEEVLETTTRQPAQPAPVFEREPLPQFAHTGAQEAPGQGHWEEPGEWEEEWGDEVVFPIEDYDDLRVAEILPLLPQLEADELEDVRDREVNTKARATIVAKIDELLGREPELPAASPPGRVPASASAARRAASPTPKKAPAKRATAGAGAAAKRTATTGRAASASARGAAKAGGTAAGAAARSAARAPSTTAKKAVAGTKAAAASKGATTSKAAGSKAAASNAAASKTGASKTAASKTGASKTGASKTAASATPVSRAAASKTVASKTGAASATPAKPAAKATKAASSKTAQPAKKAAKKATGQPAPQPRKR